LTVRNFAQIRTASVPLADLSIIVGPQATGKSLLLQWLKLAIDGRRVLGTLVDHGFSADSTAELLAAHFGDGMQAAWRASSSVSLSSHKVDPQALVDGRARHEPDRLFYVPAHRTLMLVDGWPQRLIAPEVPFVARLFSEWLLESVTDLARHRDAVFPDPGRLKDGFRRYVNDAIFHGGQLRLASTGLRRQLKLRYGKEDLSFMSWTTGQREFVPLLLALYSLLPAGKLSRREPIEWVVIEEPELGLHPRGTLAVMLFVFELLHRGYRVALATHSPVVLDVAWGVQQLAGRGSAQRLCEAFDIAPTNDVIGVMKSALGASVSVTYLHYGKNGVVSTDISSLDPASEDEHVAGWGGLTGWSGRFSAAVAADRQ
jgi:hypothetical protein